jgi:transposase
MPPDERDNPIRANAPESSYSLVEFVREFPDNAACLEWLWRNRYSEDGEHAFCPKCDRERKFHKVRERPAWDCDSCGYHVHPLAGTIFHKSSTSLHLWFFAVHLMTSTRCGVSAKHLERELGVTYKTAWRMANLIRNKLMTGDRRKLHGYVEIDETSVDGKPRRKDSSVTDPEARRKAALLKERSRATVLAAVERGGRIKATVVPSRRGPHIQRQVVEWVRPESIVYTDEWPAYNQLGTALRWS